MKKRATELEYLAWFYMSCDFGPAHGDVIAAMDRQFMEVTGKNLPIDYEEEGS